MTLTVDNRARILLLVLLFVLAASVASFMALRGMHHSSDDSAAFATTLEEHSRNVQTACRNGIPLC